MSRLDELEKAVAALPAEDLTAFRDWFERFEAERFDARIAGDISAGRLDPFADEAHDDVTHGRVRDV